MLVGGGVGVPPLYGLARRLVAAGKHPVAALGFNTAREAIRVESCARWAGTHVATLDGSMGRRDLSPIFCPRWARSLFLRLRPRADAARGGRRPPTDGEMSFEERMGCGFGACMGCSCQTKYGPKRVCKDGPVFKKGEVLS